MKKYLLLAALAVSTLTLSGQQAAPGVVTIWKKEDILKHSQALSPKLDKVHSGSEVMGTVGNRSFLIARREGDGMAEWHEQMADIMTIISGKVTLIYGGEIVNGKDTDPGEKRGDSIKGGTEVVLGPGDVFHIPAKVPHLMKVKGVLTYFVAKVKE